MKVMAMSPTIKLARTLPFGVDGCCSGAPYDPRGPCKGTCGAHSRPVVEPLAHAALALS